MASTSYPGTTFQGPLYAGPVINTGGTDVANVGSAILAQAQVVTQASAVTTICIPAGSKIQSIDLMVTTIWSGGASTLGIGSTASATAFTAAAAVAGGTLGKVSVVPGTGATQIGNWDNVGSSDVVISVTSTNTGSGVGTLTVAYIQQANLAS